MSKETLASCPFCGGEDISVKGYQAESIMINSAGFYHRVQCMSCGASKTSVTKEQTIKAWNQRITRANRHC